MYLDFCLPVDIYEFVMSIKRRLGLSWNNLIKEGIKCIEENGFIGDYHAYKIGDYEYYRYPSFDTKKYCIGTPFAKRDINVVMNFRHAYSLHSKELIYQVALCLYYKLEDKLKDLIKFNITCRNCGNIITVNAININNIALLRWIPATCPNCKTILDISKVSLEVKK